MNLTLHLVRKDLRRLRLAIFLWGVFLCGQVAAAHWLLAHSADSPDWFTIGSMLFNLLLALDALGTYFLVAALVIEDPVMGTGMFWATRPISNGRLLVAKLLVALLAFAVLPLVIWGLWWLKSDFSAAGFTSGTLRVLGLQAAAAIPAFAVATLSANLSRLLVSTFVLLLALFVATLNVLSWTSKDSLVNVARVFISLGAVGVTALTVTFWMYLTRSVGRGVLLVVVGLSLAIVAAWRWPYPWPFRWPMEAQQSTFDLAEEGKVSTSVESAWLTSVKNRDGYDDAFLVVKVRVLGLPDQFGLRNSRTSVILEWADGTTVRKSDLWLIGGRYDPVPLYGALWLQLPRGDAPLDSDPETAVKIAELRARQREKLGEEKYAKLYPGRSRYVAHSGEVRSLWMSCRVPISADIVEKVRREAPVCRVSTRFETTTSTTLGEMPLVGGATITKRGRTELVNFSEYLRPANAVFPYGAHGIISVLQEPGDAGHVEFCLVDRKKGEVGYMNTSIILPIAPIVGKIWWSPFDLSVPRVWRTDHWVSAPEWRASHYIGVLAIRPAGGFDRQMRTEKLALVSREQLEELAPSSLEEAGAN